MYRSIDLYINLQLDTAHNNGTHTHVFLYTDFSYYAGGRRQCQWKRSVLREYPVKRHDVHILTILSLGQCTIYTRSEMTEDSKF